MSGDLTRIVAALNTAGSGAIQYSGKTAGW